MPAVLAVRIRVRVVQTQVVLNDGSMANEGDELELGDQERGDLEDLGAVIPVEPPANDLERFSQNKLDAQIRAGDAEVAAKARLRAAAVAKGDGLIASRHQLDKRAVLKGETLNGELAELETAIANAAREIRVRDGEQKDAEAAWQPRRAELVAARDAVAARETRVREATERAASIRAHLAAHAHAAHLVDELAAVLHTLRCDLRHTDVLEPVSVRLLRVCAITQAGLAAERRVTGPSGETVVQD
jgi:hypothetical protein